MSTVYVFRREYHDLRVVHDGRRLIVGEGDDQVVQQFPSEHDALAHLEFMVSRRRRDGYVVERQALTDPAALGLADPLAGVLQWDAERKRATVTFGNAAAAARHCADAIDRLTRLHPETVHVVCEKASPGAAFSEALTRTPLASVRSLAVDDPARSPAQQRGNSFGDLADILAGLPELEQAYVTGTIDLRPVVQHPLRQLYLLGDPLSPRCLAALGRSKLVRLQVLGLMLRDESKADAPAAAAALHSLSAPQLAAIDVGGIDDLAAFLDVLAARPLPASWSRLSLDGAVPDESALLAVLARRASVLRALSALGLPLTDALSDAGAERAVRFLPTVVDREELPDRLSPATYDAW
jgi:hypothetical protein